MIFRRGNGHFSPALRIRDGTRNAAKSSNFWAGTSGKLRCEPFGGINERYNRGPPHSSLGPGIPEPNQDSVPASDDRHKLPAGYRVVKTSVLGGLHHEYRLVKEAA